MGEIKHIYEKNVETKKSGIKVGDILTGKSHWYRTVTYWYIVTKITNKLLTLKELDVSYPTEYMSNTPGDQCMPVIKIGDSNYLADGFPFWMGEMNHKEITASITACKTYDVQNESPEDKKWEYFADIRGDKYAPMLSLWDGKPGWVNCD